MNQIGKSLLEQKLSTSALRDCCRKKQAKELSVSMNNINLKQQVWNFEENFNEIDRKLNLNN